MHRPEGHRIVENTATIGKIDAAPVDPQVTTPRSAPRPGPFCLSVIAPMFNEEGSVLAFLDELLPVLEGLTDRFEVICVDDGSRDRTAAMVAARAVTDPRISLIEFSRNFGKEAALSAGFDHATGDAVAVIDADLQQPPEKIVEMVALWRQGWDIVNCRRASREGDGALRASLSTRFYKLYNRIAEMPIPTETSDFRLLDRSAVDALLGLPERSRFMKGLFAWVGFSAVSIAYRHRDRHAGSSSFRLWRLWNFALDGITAFSTLPLRVWSYLGFTVAFIAFFYGTITIFKALFFGIDVPGYASLLTAVLFLGGVQLISLGILGEYVGRILIETKDRPLYIVRSTINLDGARSPMAKGDASDAA
ncbi:MAG: glycosyltransferase family 2 protein [Pseudomonadota bacterium]